MSLVRISMPMLALVLALSAQAAGAQAPQGLADLVGARAAGGETELRARGYERVKAEKSDDRSYTYWWSASRSQCLSVATKEGRYDSIVATPAPDCGHSAGSGNDRDRSAYHPDIGYNAAAPSSQRQSPSYVQDRDRYQVEGQNVDLGLVCFGDGTRPGMATSYGWTWNSRTERYDYGNRTEMTGQQFDASLMVQLWSGGGRIRLPKKLVPPINSRGQDGWWDLYDVEQGPDMIRARYRLNGLNKPQVTIDRRSGRISVQGTAPYAFSGICDLVDGSDHRRF
ncbi:hypothetical protein EDF58_106299 [Novosphingobium sp. PhB57]|uniref:hypothetical protein n=1 Tax=Novosphingobium sp. PhB57 TaxID=2485107 RepID=UPI0010D5A308|nr:hypothetical protein [Novosphingobium sp. PhB57]TCU56008.1 hypothetical protein EDF58_106299 [Novosphingobium sp. PhB57]